MLFSFAVSDPPRPARKQSGLRIRRGKVLLIEDDAALAETLRRALSDQHEVTVSTSASTALDRLNDDAPFDVVLCDLELPSDVAISLYEAIARRWADQATRIVFLTSGATRGSLARFLARVPNVVLDKPIELAVLCALVDERVYRLGSRRNGEPFR